MNKQNIPLKSYIYVTIQFLSMGLIIISGSIKLTGIYLGLFLGGILLVSWAIWSMKLGNLNVLPDLKENGKLVTKGPYRFIRHPMYSSVLLTMLAFVLYDFSVFRLILWVILLIDLILKLSYEEEILENNFFEYSQYRKQTKKLVPYIF